MKSSKLESWAQRNGSVGQRLFLVAVLVLFASAPSLAQSETNAYFGDLHVHTRFSFDAFIFGTRSTPEDAYRFALGEPIEHAAGFEIKLDRPLDFYAVTDHANYLGMLEAMSTPEHPLSKLERAKELTETRTVDEKRRAFRGGGAYVTEHLDKGVIASTWQKVIEAAEKYNDPGRFTTFVAYEYTSGFGGNLHRNVIYKSRAAPALPFSRLDSLNPEKLWDWMDEQRELGYEALAIPHNANASNGHMFALETFDGEPLSPDYATQRMRNEPLVEVTQVKGTSDTHPFLSPDDEWADFEIFPYQIARWDKSRPQGSYVREAYGHGLELEETKGFNPYRFGLIGSSDTHNGGGSYDETNFFSKVGVLDADGPSRGSVPVPSEAPVDVFAETYYRFWGASGLAGIWAQENTREALYDAMRRKETFATTGPRIKVRFFGSFDFPGNMVGRSDAVRLGYSLGVPMGGDLVAADQSVDQDADQVAPVFFAWAIKDPLGTRLQRLQVIKVWLEDGRATEQVYDVACSDGGTVDAESHRCPDNGARVDLSDCSIDEGLGADELKALWRDPDWQKGQRSTYYVRVLENPTCRWSTWDAVRAGTTPRPDLPATLQERAWSSPIWVR